jgi:hypothetical protein
MSIVRSNRQNTCLAHTFIEVAGSTRNERSSKREPWTWRIWSRFSGWRAVRKTAVAMITPATTNGVMTMT